MGARAVIFCMDRTNWEQSKLRLQNLAKSLIQMPRWFLHSPTHQGRFVPPLLTASKLRVLHASQVIPVVTLFYNAPDPPSGTFDAFLELPSLQKDIQTSSYVNFIKAQATQTTSPVGLR
jgi:hypothetical protein